MIEAPAVSPDASRLVDNVVHFARILRRAGMAVGPAHVIDAVEALEAAGIENRQDVYWSLHAVFVTRREQRLIFDEAFNLFWRTRGLTDKMIAMMSPVAPPRAPKAPRAGDQRIADAMFGNARREQPNEKPILEIDARLTASEREILQRKDFARMSAAEIAAAMQAVRAMVMPLDRVETRRRVAGQKGGVVDLRRTLRQSLRGGAGGLQLAFSHAREEHPPIVALLDISGSMTEYSRLFLHFLHALSARRKVTSFLFGTRLTNVTRQLRYKDPDEALGQVSAEVADWAGGTRIGEALERFNRLWSRRVMAGGPIVLLISDGLERDETDLLSHELDRLHRSCRRLIWLNPLLRFDGFEARAAGVRAMLPHVDDFRPVHSLRAISDLVKALGEEGTRGKRPREWLAG